MESIVKWFKDEKGYGFIRYKGKVVSIHCCIYGDGHDNVVEIELVKDGKGYKLKNISQKEEAA